MSKRNLVKAYDKLINEANKAKLKGDAGREASMREEAKFVMELINELG